MAQNQPLKIRLPEDMLTQLRLVSKTVNRPMNKLVQEAVAAYLRSESKRLAEELSPRVEKLRAYAADPNGRRNSLAATVAAEAEMGGNDPAEGTRI